MDIIFVNAKIHKNTLIHLVVNQVVNAFHFHVQLLVQ